MDKTNISLGPVQETLLIPLLGRAVATRQGSGLINDPRAVEIVDQLAYDFSKWEKGQSLLGSVLRTRMLDDDVKEFIATHPRGTVVEIGCGLNTRFERVDNGSVRWFDLDLPDTIALRRRFFADSERQTMVAASVLDANWVQHIRETGGPFCFVSEAVLIYLAAADAERAVRQLVSGFPAGSWLLMDTTPKAMVDGQAKHDAMKHLPKSSWFRWAVDDPRELERLGLTLIQSRSFADAGSELIRPLPWSMRFLIRWAPWALKRMTKGYQLNRFEIRKA
ncbi:class I SAM-dependent methyltransferase [Halomonas faecis]|uniref:class I SAM-dependent methyltransferase n=1 Tax=Halomonas faecis TaxID=1562110 RepID=UPI0013D7440A|nr:class I SAM-dependent methyltransferase [Halomonas faecis]